MFFSTAEPQKLYGVQGPLRSSYMTCVLHNARIMSQARDKTKKHLSLFLNRAKKFILFFIPSTKHDAIDIADPKRCWPNTQKAPGNLWIIIF